MKTHSVISGIKEGFNKHEFASWKKCPGTTEPGCGGEHLNHRRRVLNDFAFDGLLTPRNREQCHFQRKGRKWEQGWGGVGKLLWETGKKKSNGDENTCAKTQLRLK